VSKHDIVVADLVRTGSDDLFWRASGTCNGQSFDAKSILYQGSPIFKIVNAGPVLNSPWSRGERAAVARACRHKMLTETGQLPVAQRRQKASRRKRRDPNVKYHHSGWPMNSSISALKRSR